MTNFSGDITELSAQTVRQNIVYAQTPEEEKWRMEVIKDMKDVIACSTVNSNLSMEEASDILTFACTSQFQYCIVQSVPSTYDVYEKK